MIPVLIKQENICPQAIEFGDPTELDLFFQPDYLHPKYSEIEIMKKKTKLLKPDYGISSSGIDEFDSLADYALDMRCSWNHEADEIWLQLEPDLWIREDWAMWQVISSSLPAIWECPSDILLTVCICPHGIPKRRTISGQKPCGKDRWLGMCRTIDKDIRNVSDEKLWEMRTHEKKALIQFAREHFPKQLLGSGLSSDTAERNMLMIQPSTQ